MGFGGLPSPHVWHALCMKTATEKKLKRINYHGGDDDASHDYGDGDIDDDEYDSSKDNVFENKIWLKFLGLQPV